MAIFENKWYHIHRENICVVCGNTEKLTKHHIIPSCYTAKLDKDIKKTLKNVHFEPDYCCTCKKCHKKYEILFSERLHRKIWEKFNVNLLETSYRQPRSNRPKPSEVVMNQIKNFNNYIILREFCTEYFIECMKPKFDIFSGKSIEEIV
jgi:hypothetical protein